MSELNHLEETENLYHSNLFRMQIDELLKEVKRPKQAVVDAWLKKFSKFVKSLPAIPEQSFEDISNKKTVCYPLLTKLQDVSKCLFEFVPPEEEPFVFGAQKFDTNLGESVLTVDIGVEMPFSLSKKDDYLNQRIMHKKAYYLQVIAENALNRPKLGTVKFNNFQSDPMRPVLELERVEENVKFIVHVFMNKSSFKLNRFAPEKNNVRSYLALSEADLICPTPHYNSNILFDLTLQKNEAFAEGFVGSQPNVQDAIVLLKIWLKQRHFDEGFYGFNGHLMTLFICHLLKIGKATIDMSSYQIIRMVWLNLSSSKWDTEGISLAASTLDVNKPSLEDFHKHFEVVFIDSSGYLNLAGNLSKDLYGRVKQESLRAIQCLDNKKSDSFNFLFMKKFPIFTQYDHIFT